MIKEIRYILFILMISLFLFFTIKFYFSDENKKHSFRMINQIDNKIKNYSEKLPVLKDDTLNIIEYIDQSDQKKRNKFNFLKLIDKNE